MICPNCKKEISEVKKLCPNCKYVFISEETKTNLNIILTGLASLALSICTFLSLKPDMPKNNKILIITLGVLFLLVAIINLFPRTNSSKIEKTRVGLAKLYNIIPNIIFISLLGTTALVALFSGYWPISILVILLIMIPIISLIKSLKN